MTALWWVNNWGRYNNLPWRSRVAFAKYCRAIRLATLKIIG